MWSDKILHECGAVVGGEDVAFAHGANRVRRFLNLRTHSLKICGMVKQNKGTGPWQVQRQTSCLATRALCSAHRRCWFERRRCCCRLPVHTFHWQSKLPMTSTASRRPPDHNAQNKFGFMPGPHPKMCRWCLLRNKIPHHEGFLCTAPVLDRLIHQQRPQTRGAEQTARGKG